MIGVFGRYFDKRRAVLPLCVKAIIASTYQVICTTMISLDVGWLDLIERRLSLRNNFFHCAIVDIVLTASKG